MADITISDLSPVNSVNLSDVIPLSNGSTTNKATVLQVLSGNAPLNYGTLTGTTQSSLSQSFTINRAGWLMVVGDGSATINAAGSYNSGLRIRVNLNGNQIASDYSFEGSSSSVIFTCNAIGMRLLTPGTHTIAVFSDIGPSWITRDNISLSWLVIPV